MVSDASIQKNGQSRFAWIIANNHVILWHGHGLAPGPIDDTYSGHAEAYGILAAVTFLCFYVQCYDHHIPSQTLTCYCDNSGVVTNLTSMKDCVIVRPNDTTNDDHDLYAAITAEADKCRPVRITYIHVKGHQDANKEKPLTIEAIKKFKKTRFIVLSLYSAVALQKTHTLINKWRRVLHKRLRNRWHC